MLLKKKTPSWIEPIIPLVRAQVPINRLQGSVTANMLLLAPLPTQVECDNNLCWCSNSAVFFFDLIAGECECAVDDFLVVPLTFTGNKPVANEVAVSKAIVNAAAHSKTITKFVCIGGTAFKAYFGNGKKGNINTLASGIPLRTPELQFKPLFVFPDSEILNMETPPRDKKLSRDEFWQLQFKEKTAASYMRLMPQFKTFINS